MDEEYCSFKKDGCPVPSSSPYTCFKGDEKICTIAIIIKTKLKKTTEERGVTHGKE